MPKFYSIEQARTLALRRLPRFAFDFLDGGAGSELSIAANLDELKKLALVPRVLTGAGGQADLSTTLFGKTYAAPFGVAPMGLPSIAWPGAERGLAQVAARNGLPFVLSSAAGTTITEITSATSEGHVWFQLYPGPGDVANDPRIKEAQRAGVEVLVITVDRPVMGWRVRDLAHGVGLTFRMTTRAAISLATHPRWSLATLRAGKPRPAYPMPPANNSDSGQTLNWALIETLRKVWSGALVVKGILHPEDARIAASCGVDGVVISNHGGAHLESAVASSAQLPAIRDAVGRNTRILHDGGIRSGEDVAKALALGADFVLLGRAFAYAVAADGPERGPQQAVDLLFQGLSRALTLMGCAHPTDLGAAHLAVRGEAPVLKV